MSKVSLPNNILYFFARFLLFYLVTIVLWFFIHPYYETLLWLFTIKASQWVGYIPFHTPEKHGLKRRTQVMLAAFLVAAGAVDGVAAVR